VGAGVADGVIVLQESVTVPVYPLIGVTARTVVAVLPACTLVGVSAVVMVTVYSGTALSTVRFTAAVRVPDESVPVTVAV
jgi:hypothetical protein